MKCNPLFQVHKRDTKFAQTFLHFLKFQLCSQKMQICICIIQIHQNWSHRLGQNQVGSFLLNSFMSH